MRAVLILAALACSCGGASPDRVRYANRAPVWVVDDRQNVPETPAEREFYRMQYFFDSYFHNRVVRGTRVTPYRRAQNINSLGEVPDSTWFENRIGKLDLTAQDVRRGPNLGPGPMAYKPWTIKSSKVGGQSIGFLIEDTAGSKYLLKFEESGYPELQSAADIISARILWAAGYNVPQDRVVELRRDDLVIAEDAQVKGLYGEKTPMTPEFVAQQLAKVDVGPDGTIRAFTSKFVDGTPIGGWVDEGTRPDDPNDRVPHELRRDLRGLYVFLSWLDQVDIKESNTVDAWQEDPEDPAIHYVKHYLVDFDKGLGVYEYIEHIQHGGHAYLLDFGAMLQSLFSLGLVPRDWEGRNGPALRGVGLWEAHSFDPGDWKAMSPSVLPLHRVDRFDAFWAAKIVARFTPAMLRAAVEEARYSDPRATEYVTRVLIARQRKIMSHWFRQTNPIDDFGLEGDRLCFVDLALHYGTEDAETHYRLRSFDFAGRATGWKETAVANERGRVCVDGVRAGPTHEGYSIVEIRTDRGEERSPPPTLVHLARDPRSGRLRIIGIRRM